MQRAHGDASIQPGKTPFIGCFQTDKYAYLYDVNKNAIVRIPGEVCKKLTRLLESGGSLQTSDNKPLLREPVIASLLEQGFFSTARANKVALGYDEDVITRRIDGHINQCILELTQHCNLDCLYCSFSPFQEGRRNHSAGSMPWSVAKAAIDYFLSHSRLLDRRSLGFYGGEPLLEWPLLKRCVEYARQSPDEENLQINFTTNATLITDEIAEFCAKHEIRVQVSLDGPAEAHDACRVFKGDGTGSSRATMTGLTRLKKAYGNDPAKKLSIHAVFGPWSDVEKVIAYFTRNAPEWLRELQVTLTPASLSESNRERLSDPDNPLGAQSLNRLKRRWLAVLAGTQEVEPDELELLRGLFQEPYLRFYHRKSTPLNESLPPKGMCLPGVRRMYVDHEGRILPCERVSERDEYCLGHILNGGVDAAKSIEVCRLIEDWFSKRCPNCIYCRICSGCLSRFTDSEGEMSDSHLDYYCRQKFNDCGEFLVSWAKALEENPACFDYMERISL